MFCLWKRASNRTGRRFPRNKRKKVQLSGDRQRKKRKRNDGGFGSRRGRHAVLFSPWSACGLSDEVLLKDNSSMLGSCFTHVDVFGQAKLWGFWAVSTSLQLVVTMKRRLFALDVCHHEIATCGDPPLHVCFVQACVLFSLLRTKVASSTLETVQFLLLGSR